MALEGSIKDFGLADIFQLIYFQKKTGILSLSGRNDRITLTFYEGNTIYAESLKRTEENRLGRILFKKGFIKEDDLRAALEEQKTTGVKLGDIFLKKGLIEKAAILETLTSQLTETVIQLFSWKSGTYEFQQQSVSFNKDMPISLDTQHLLMEGMRVIDEWSLIEGKITLDTVFKRTDKAEHNLTTEEKDILEFIDGENDVSIIIELSRMDDVQISKALLELSDKGIIEPLKVSLVEEEAVTYAAAAERPVNKFLPLAVFIFAMIISLAATIFIKTGLQNGLSALWGGNSFKKIKTTEEIEKLRFMAEASKLKNGAYPLRLSEMGDDKDPWGRPYVYKTENDILMIISSGPDGKTGTSDDVY